MKPDIIIENSAELYEDESPVIIPVTFKRFADGKTEVTAYPETAAAVREYIEATDDLFDKAALKNLCASLSVIVNDLGYEPDRPQKHLVFEASDADAVNSGMVNDLTQIITGTQGYKNLTTYRIEDDETCAAVITDGCIAAVCALNLSPDGSMIRELNVQCAPKLRRKGYASSCVAALTRHLLQTKQAHSVRYECRESNRGSAKTALKAGLKLFAEAFYYVCYLK